MELEKSDCLHGRGQHEINTEEGSSAGNQGKEETSIKLNYIKEEVLISSEAESWSAVLSSPKQAACSNGVLVDPLESRNNYGQNSDTDVDGWINDGIGNALPSNDYHAAEKGIHSSEISSQQHFIPPHHETEHGKRQPLMCFHCDRLFSSEGSLVEHMRRAHAEENQFTAQDQVRRHTGAHGGGKGNPQGQKRGSRTGRQGPKTTFPWTDEQEEDLVNWWRENESLYNSTSKGYLDKCRREKLYAAKAEEIGVGCNADDVQIHMRSMRTKLNHILKEGPTGEGWQPRTPRGKWVWDKLHFILPFIIHRNIKSTNKFGKGSSGEDSPSGGSDISMGVETIPGTSNDVGSVSSLRESYSVVQSRSRGRPRGARHDIPPKKAKVDVGIRGQLLRTKSTTTKPGKILMTYNPHTSIHRQPQPSVEVPEAPTTSMPTTSTHHQPVSSTDEEEVKAFLGHLKCTLLRIPADLRMEVQADILAMVYARHKEHRQSCKQP